MKKNAHEKLSDLGERRIIDELIKRRFLPNPTLILGIGDDCAVIPSPPPGHDSVFTIDPCPTPVICLIEPNDWYHYGWLTVLINVSDLAAMGAKPIGILISTVMPEDMLVSDYERFLEGVSDACHEWSCPVIGGNIKDGPEFSATGSAIGAVKKDLMLRRSGAKPGDRVCVIGEMGFFWAGVLTRLESDIKIDTTHKSSIDKALYKPQAKIKEGIALSQIKKATACMDSSDGITGCLYEIARVNEVDITINDASLIPNPAVKEVANLANIEPQKLMLSWGNWELIFTTPPEAFDEIKEKIESFGTPCTDIGYVHNGCGRVRYETSDSSGLLTNYASERFCKTSIFSHGLDAYISYLKKNSIFYRNKEK
jgi:thiamine-monophosphate kinase